MAKSTLLYIFFAGSGGDRTPLALALIAHSWHSFGLHPPSLAPQLGTESVTSLAVLLFSNTYPGIEVVFGLFCADHIKWTQVTWALRDNRMGGSLFVPIAQANIGYSTQSSEYTKSKTRKQTCSRYNMVNVFCQFQE